jgi:hypothetical protein
MEYGEQLVGATDYWDYGISIHYHDLVTKTWMQSTESNEFL